MRILVVHQSIDGQTAKIAHQIARVLAGRGHALDVRDARTIPTTLSPRAYDGVILGGPIRWGALPHALRLFLRDHGAALSRMPAWLFTVSVTALRGHEGRARCDAIAYRSAGKCGFAPSRVEHFAGALAYPRYGALGRAVARLVAKKSGLPTDVSKAHELTDWAAVRAFAVAFEHHLASQAVHDVSAERGEFAPLESEAKTVIHPPDL